jgi:hypothetical protein
MKMMNMIAEKQRLQDTNWKNWGPYVSNRQWGNVREDYSPNGDAWNFANHNNAESYAYRWGEEGIAEFLMQSNFSVLRFLSGTKR